MRLDVPLETLKNKTLTKIEKVDGVYLYFIVNDEEAYVLFHDQDCCKEVYIEDIVGDLDDLVKSPILLAEEVSNSEEPFVDADSYTWTFYKMATIKGSVTIRWYCRCTGDYSERVDFFRAIKCPKCNKFSPPLGIFLICDECFRSLH